MISNVKNWTIAFLFWLKPSLKYFISERFVKMKELMKKGKIMKLQIPKSEITISYIL